MMDADDGVEEVKIEITVAGDSVLTPQLLPVDDGVLLETASR